MHHRVIPTTLKYVHKVAHCSVVLSLHLLSCIYSTYGRTYLSSFSLPRPFFSSKLKSLICVWFSFPLSPRFLLYTLLNNLQPCTLLFPFSSPILMAEKERATSSEADQFTVRDLVTSDEVREIHLTIDKEWGPLQQSARQTAAIRALWGHVVKDPLADVLAGERLLQGLYEKMRRDRMRNAKEISGVMLAIRTLWFDARLEAAIEAFGGGHVQLVLLGAGMDTRAYRLNYLKNTTIFELDFPDLLQLKSDLIKQAIASSDNQTDLLTVSSDRLIHVPADLRKPNWLQMLTDSGFSPGTNTIWLLEGILYYLSHDDAMQVLETIARALEKTAHTVLLADIMNKSAVSLSNDIYKFYSDWPDQLLPRFGFCNVKVSQIGDLDANFGLLTDPENLFERRRKIPRSVDIDPLDGSPCCRLYFVEATKSLLG